MKKASILFIFLFCFLFLGRAGVQASIVTIDKNGQVTVKVLASRSDLSIKEIKEEEGTPSDSQVSLTRANGKIALSITSEEGERNIDISNLGGDLVEIEERPQVKNIKIGIDNGQFTISQEDVLALTTFPISIDPEEARVSLLTPSGQRFLSVFPKDALESGLRAKAMTKLKKGSKILIAEVDARELVYELDGERTINLFNLVSLDIPVRATISAFTGEIVNVEQPAWLKVLGFVFS
jgi:hypothetical protein